MKKQNNTAEQTTATVTAADLFNNANSIPTETWHGIEPEKLAADLGCPLPSDDKDGWTKMADLIGREIVITSAINRTYKDKESGDTVHKVVYLCVPRAEVNQIVKFSSESTPFNDRLERCTLPVKGKIEKRIKGTKSYYVFAA